MRGLFLGFIAALCLVGCSPRGARGGQQPQVDSVAAVTSLTVYLERSGSMVPYDTPGGRGELKRAVNGIVNAIGNADSVAIAIVNDSVYPYSGSVRQFMQDRDIYGSTAGVGDAAYTDFQLILRQMLDNLHAGNVSVLVSDLIYSPRGVDGVSVEKLFTEERGVLHNVFNARTDLDVVVHKMRGDYNGKYYPAMGGSFAYHGDRPFYLVVVADHATMAAMRGNEALAAALLRPADAMASYHYGAEGEVAAKVLPRHESNQGRWRAQRGERLSLTGCQPDATTGKLAFTLAVDLTSTQRDSAFLVDSGNYHVASLSGFTLTVTPIDAEMITGNNKRYLEGMTHLLTLTGEFSGAADNVVVTMDNGLPQWVVATNATDDTSPLRADFATTTMGLLPFMQGIYDAYHAAAAPLFTIEVSLKN